MIHVLVVIPICFFEFHTKMIKDNHTVIFYTYILNVPVHHVIGTYVHFILIFHNNCRRIYFVKFLKTNLPIPIMEQKNMQITPGPLIEITYNVYIL